MRVDVMPTHDAHTLYLRWEILYEGFGKEVERLKSLGGPVSLDVDTSCFIDFGGNRHEVAKIRVPIWPYPGPKNIGQARFWDVDSRRRFWVNLQEAVTTTVVDWMWLAKPGSVDAKPGAVIRVPEKPGSPLHEQGPLVAAVTGAI
jgi:hypothetical protein